MGAEGGILPYGNSRHPVTSAPGVDMSARVSFSAPAKETGKFHRQSEVALKLHLAGRESRDRIDHPQGNVNVVGDGGGDGELRFPRNARGDLAGPSCNGH